MHWWPFRNRDADLKRELQAALELEEEEQRDRGLSAEEAHYAARRAFGNPTLIAQQTHEAWGSRAIENLWQDLRYALRQVKRYPSFTAVVVAVLAVGIGANCAIFSFVDAVFLKPLPVPHPERLVRIYARGPSGHYGAGFSYPEFEHLRQHVSSMNGIAVENERPQLHLVLGDNSIEIPGNFVSANYFHVLGIEPRLGRGFLPEEDRVPGRDAVVVISDGLWRAQFNREPAVLGRVISINSILFKVVGVAPPDFYGDVPGEPIDVWIPAMMYGAAGYACDDGTYNCSLIDQMIGTLAPGFSMAQAQAEAASSMIWSASNWVKRPAQRQVAIASANRASPDDQADDAAQLRLLLSVTVSLLVIACANLAGLLLARGLMQRREIAVRLAIGAAGSRIVRQLLTESLVLATLGGIAGLVLSIGGKKVLSDFYAVDSEGFRHFYDLQFDWRAAAFSIGLTVAAGIFFGLLPAFRAVRQDLVTDLKDGGSTEQLGKGRVRSLLVMGQIALSIVLVVASGLLMRSAAKLRRGTNFEAEKALVVRLRPELMKYTPNRVEALVRRVSQRLSAEPNVDSLSYMQGGEGLVWNWQNGRNAGVSLTAETRDHGAGLQALKQDVGSGFFKTLRIPLLQGRGISEQDVAGSPPVVVINHALAQRLLPSGRSVAGLTLYIDSKPYQIVGVSADLQPANRLYATKPHVYLSYWQSNSIREGDVRFVLRVRDDPARVLPRVRRAIQSIDANVPIGEDMPLAVQVRLEYMPVLLAQRVMTFCGFLALSLSAMGLYSVLAFAVRARSLEIGVRMALGARKADVVRLFLWEGARMALAGAGAGVAAALLATRLLRRLLYGVEATDPGIIMGAVGLLVLVALAACVVPAGRAASISPMRVLRSE